MAKKKKTQTQEGPVEAPVNDNVFPEAGAVQATAQAAIPNDVAELIKATLTVMVAQRRMYGFATTVTSLAKSVTRALSKYVDSIPMQALREFIKKELEAMGYKIVVAVIDYSGVKVEAETVILYRNFEEIVEMLKAGRLESLKPVIANDGPDPLFDKVAREVKKAAHA